MGDTHMGDTHMGDTHMGDTHMGDTCDWTLTHAETALLRQRLRLENVTHWYDDAHPTTTTTFDSDRPTITLWLNDISRQARDTLVRDMTRNTERDTERDTKRDTEFDYALVPPQAPGPTLSAVNDGVDLGQFPRQEDVSPAQWGAICQLLSDLSTTHNTTYEHSTDGLDDLTRLGGLAHTLCGDLGIPYGNPDAEQAAQDEQDEQDNATYAIDMTSIYGVEHYTYDSERDAKAGAFRLIVMATRYLREIDGVVRTLDLDAVADFQWDVNSAFATRYPGFDSDFVRHAYDADDDTLAACFDWLLMIEMHERAGVAGGPRI